MSDAQGITEQNWVQESKDRARFLQSRAGEIRRALFAGGDLTDFLDLLARLHRFDPINLLLIYDRYPEATFLAGYKVWSLLIQPPGAQILKRRWIGKGIELVAPFTEIRNGRYQLTWYCLRVFDITQTNVEYASPSGPYQQDDRHLSFLLKSLKDLLKHRFLRPTLYIQPTEMMQAAGIPGFLLDGKTSAIQIRSDLSEEKQLCWLTEILVQLSIPASAQLPKPAEHLLINCGVYCLLHTWGLSAVPPYTTLQARQLTEEEQLPFLDLLHRIVRDLDAHISGLYLSYREIPSSDETLTFPQYPQS